MTISYDKWNTLDEYTSSGSEDSDNSPTTTTTTTPNTTASTRRRPPATTTTGGGRQRKKRLARQLPSGFGSSFAGRPPATFVTVPWDPFSEKVRWALDRHSVPYLEHTWPWGLHLFATLPYSDAPPTRQVTWTPILKIESGEVFKRNNTTDIMLWLYSRSLCARERLYTPESPALELEKYFDEHLAPAAQVIFYHVVLSNPRLVRQCLFDAIALEAHRSLFRLAWPLLRVALRRHFRLGDANAIREAWEAVDRSFAKAEDALLRAGTGARYLCGDSITAADIAFGAYAEFVLFPNQTDHVSTSETVPVVFPATSQLPPDARDKIVRLRNTPAGKFAFRLYRSERDPRTTGGWPSRYEKSARPWWSRYELLRNVAAGSAAAAVVFVALLITACGPLVTLAILVVVCAVAALYVATSPGLATTRRLAGQIRFLMFGKPEDKPAPAAADLGGDAGSKS